MDNLSYLFAANLFVWLGIAFYILRLHKQGQNLRRDLDLIKSTIKPEDHS